MLHAFILYTKGLNARRIRLFLTCSTASVEHFGTHPERQSRSCCSPWWQCSSNCTLPELRLSCRWSVHASDSRRTHWDQHKWSVRVSDSLWTHSDRHKWSVHASDSRGTHWDQHKWSVRVSDSLRTYLSQDFPASDPCTLRTHFGLTRTDTIKWSVHDSDSRPTHWDQQKWSVRIFDSLRTLLSKDFPASDPCTLRTHFGLTRTDTSDPCAFRTHFGLTRTDTIKWSVHDSDSRRTHWDQQKWSVHASDSLRTHSDQHKWSVHASVARLIWRSVSSPCLLTSSSRQCSCSVICSTLGLLQKDGGA